MVTPGGSSETMFSFCGRVNSKDEAGIHGIKNEGEDIRVIIVRAMKAFKMLNHGQIKNSMTIISLQWFQKNREKISFEWLKYFFYSVC